MDRRKPTWFERKNKEFLEKLRQNPEAHTRARGSWFGRFMLQTAERSDESWTPDESELVVLRTRAERVTVNSLNAGWLVLTDNRLAFKPILEVGWAPWTIRSGEMPTSALRAKSGHFLSRMMHLRPFWMSVGHLAGWVHVANLKVSNGRRSWWLRVDDPHNWERILTEVSNRNENNAGGAQ